MPTESPRRAPRVLALIVGATLLSAASPAAPALAQDAEHVSSVALHRLRMTNGDDCGGDYFYTTSVEEANTAQQFHGYTLEGVVAHVSPRALPGTKPVYRYTIGCLVPFAKPIPHHTLSTDPDRCAGGGSCTREGGEFYVATEQRLGTTPLFQLNQGSSAVVLLLTTNAQERSDAPAQGYTDAGTLGFAWSGPTALALAAPQVASVSPNVIVREQLAASAAATRVKVTYTGTKPDRWTMAFADLPWEEVSVEPIPYQRAAWVPIPTTMIAQATWNSPKKIRIRLENSAGESIAVVEARSELQVTRPENVPAVTPRGTTTVTPRGTTSLPKITPVKP